MLKITGPSNSEAKFVSDPPSTLIALPTDISCGVIKPNPTLDPEPRSGSSPVTVGIGVPNTSSSPVIEMLTLFLVNRSPSSSIPV